MKSITFPSMTTVEETKLKRLVETIGEYMGAKITTETVIVMRANFPDDRPDIEQIFKRLAGNKTGLVKPSQNQSAEPEIEK